MSGVVKINITEDPETLQTLLSQQKTAQGVERVQALYLLKTKQVETVQHLIPHKLIQSNVSGRKLKQN
jgi:hypothetical protein